MPSFLDTSRYQYLAMKTISPTKISINVVGSGTTCNAKLLIATVGLDPPPVESVVEANLNQTLS